MLVITCLPRRWLTVGLAFLSLGLLLMGHPFPGVALTCLAVASLGAPSLSVLIDRLAPVVVGVLAWVIVSSHAAGLFGLGLFSSTIASRTVLASPALLAAAWAFREPPPTPTPGSHALGRDTTWPAVLTGSPALLWLLLGAIGSRLNGGAGMGWFADGIDNFNHALLAHYLAMAGGLTTEGFLTPAGAHSAIALFLAAGGSPTGSGGALTSPPQTGLAALLQTAALTMWCSYAVIILAVSVLTRRVLHIVTPRIPGWAAAVAAAASGLAIMVKPFTAVLGLGFLTYIVCALALTAAIVAVTDSPRSALGAACNVVVVAASLTIAIHTWPVAALAVAPAGAIAVVTFLRSRPTWTTILATAAAVAPLAASTLVTAWATLLTVDPVARTEKGGIVPPIHVIPVIWLGLGIPLALVLLRVRLARLVAITVLLLGLMAGGLAVGVRVAITSYYPSKLLALAGLLAVPTATAGLSWAVFGLRRLQPAVGRAMTAVAGLAALALSLSGIIGVSRMALTPSDEWSAMYAAAVHPLAPEATIAWDIPVGSRRVAYLDRMLDYYRLDDQILRTFPRTRTRALDCADLTASPHPAVLTHYSQAQVDAHYTCVPGTRALTVPPNPNP